MAITHTGTSITGVTNTGTNIQTVTHTGTEVFTAVSWRAVSIGERVSYSGISNAYYRGMYASTPPAASGSTPMFAIRSDGLQHAIINIGTFWIINNTAVSPRGTTLPTSPNVGDMFFLINSGLYIAE